ncbi:LysR family transcriptional regulator [Paenibacillus sp. R14(2021)]|uniref:LysR family transcriptional regulator n=1 Tax=Paenibacillus sp. R14(2021) TaxID=2859228 RepID=UPI00280AAF76|nr:LysR family transcriptional regulator [Paenibacillus sp. R14(2021)]
MLDNNLEWYRSFYWCAKTGSLSRAAERLHITQPAVSHTIKQLEERLGGPLFIRGARGVQLTAEGEVLFRYVEQALQYMETGEKKILDMHQLAMGDINIGAGDTICKHVLLPYLERFHDAYPQIRIRVTNRTTPETVSLLKEGIIDLGLVHLPAKDNRIEIVGSLPLQDCLVGGSRYAELAGKPLKLRELEGYPLLLLEEGTSTRNFLDTYSRGYGVELKEEFSLGSMDLLAEFAKSGFGLTFLVREYYKQELEAGELVEFPMEEPIPARYIGIAVLRGVPRTQAAKRFLEMLPMHDPSL